MASIGPFLIVCEAVATTVFLATMYSVSAPCGMTGDAYWGTSSAMYLQSTDAANTLLRGVLLVAVIAYFSFADFDAGSIGRVLHTLYAVVTVYLFVSSVIAAFSAMGLDCPNADNTMGCTESNPQFWMVPGNYCPHEITNNDKCSTTEQSRNEVQMCVRLGRAPLVNGAMAAWFMRTLLVDAVRLVLVGAVLAGVLVVVQSEEKGGDMNSRRSQSLSLVPTEAAAERETGENNSETPQRDMPLGTERVFTPDTQETQRIQLARPPSTRMHERDTLLAAGAADNDVIRQSPHVRKRAASAFKIDF